MEPCNRYWKIASIVLGIMIVVLALYSHIDSDWRIANQDFDPCQQKAWNTLNIYDRKYKWCPDIAIEYYFVVINVICLIVSLLSFYYSTTSKNPSYFLQKLDIFYHWVVAFLLLLAAILLIASTIQIANMRLYARGRAMEMRTIEKAFAGALTIIQAFVCGTIAYFLGRGD